MVLLACGTNDLDPLVMDHAAFAGVGFSTGLGFIRSCILDFI